MEFIASSSASSSEAEEEATATVDDKKDIIDDEESSSVRKTFLTRSRTQTVLHRAHTIISSYQKKFCLTNYNK